MTRRVGIFGDDGEQVDDEIYLYPMPETLIEEYVGPLKPQTKRIINMFGGKLVVVEEVGSITSQIHWNERTAKDYYLNHLLIHEIGHVLDDRNTSVGAREAYADWFADEYGYKPTMHLRRSRRVKKRHHSV